MSQLLTSLVDKDLISIPSWVPLNTVYLTVIGSQAYGLTVETSDCDVYGVCIPPKDHVFPHLRGEILDFGTHGKRFAQWQQHKVFDQTAQRGKGVEYDFQIFSIVKYFDLLMKNNPTVIDSLFVPYNCIIHCTAVGNLIRENRKLFLSKECFTKFKGYAFSQLHKMQGKNPVGKRKEIRDKFGYDTKYAVHLVRLLGECEQILMYGDLDIQRNNEHLKAIRRGEVAEQEVYAWFKEKETGLEKLFVESKLREQADENEIKNLLLRCLEHHYGSLGECITVPDKHKMALTKIKSILEENGL